MFSPHKVVRLAIGMVLLLALAPTSAGAMPTRASQSVPMEPLAGSWHTWVLITGSELRPGPPPDAAATRAELDQLQTLTAQRDANALGEIAFWDTGAPSYRWNELAMTEALKHNLNSNFGTRALALMHVALSDAIVATWDAKFAYQRPRPSIADPFLAAALPVSASPSYPSEHAATAAAASAVLAYLFPDDA